MDKGPWDYPANDCTLTYYLRKDGEPLTVAHLAAIHDANFKLTHSLEATTKERNCEA